jgi:hypothetical protein
VCFGFFAPISNNDTESKIAKDKKNSRTTQMFTYTFFEEIQKNHDCSTVFVITLFGYINRYEGLNYFVVSVVRNQHTYNVVFLSPLNL